MAGLPPGPQAKPIVSAGSTPEQIDAVLKGLPPEAQDQVLAKLPLKDIQAYADWSKEHNDTGGTQDLTTTDLPGGGEFASSRRRPVDTGREPTDEEMKKMTDEQIQALIDGKTLDAGEVGPPPEEQGALRRGVGITARAGLKGALAIPLAVFDKIGEVPGVTGSNDMSDALDRGLTSTGFAQPETSGERVYSDIVGGVAGALSLGGAGAGVRAAAGTGLKATLADAVASTTGRQAIAGALGGGAGGIVRENGGTPGEQLAASLIAGLSPSMGKTLMTPLIRRAIRGGKDGIATMKDNISTFENAGTFPSVGQATGGNAARGLEAALSRFYGSSGKMLRFGRGQEDQIGAKIRAAGEELNPSGFTPQDTGTLIKDDYKSLFLPQEKAATGSAYDRFQDLLKSNPLPRTGGLTQAEQAAADLAHNSFATTGSELSEAIARRNQARTEALLRTGRQADTLPENVYTQTAANPAARARTLQANDKLAAAEDEVLRLTKAHEQSVADLRSVQNGDQIKPTNFVPLDNTLSKLKGLITPIPGAVKSSGSKLLTSNGSDYEEFLQNLRRDVATNGGNGLPLEAVMSLRTRIGDQLANSVINSGIPATELRSLYGTLSEDIRAALSKAGPDVRNAFEKANTMSSQFHDQLDILKGVVEKKGGGEKIFRAAVSGLKDGDSTVSAVNSVLSPANRKIFSGAFIQRMMKPVEGTGVTQGDFGLQNFFKNYEAMSDSTRAQIFGNLPKEMQKDFEEISKTAYIIRNGKEDFGSASKAQEGRTGMQQLLYPLLIISGGAAGAGVDTLKAGAAGLVGAGGVAGTSRLIANKMTDPKFVHWLASTNNIPKSMLPSAINLLAQQAVKDHDDELLEVSKELQKQTQEEDQ